MINYIKFKKEIVKKREKKETRPMKRPDQTNKMRPTAVFFFLSFERRRLRCTGNTYFILKDSQCSKTENNGNH